MNEFLIYGDDQYNLQISKNISMLSNLINAPFHYVSNDSGSRSENLSNLLVRAESVAKQLGMEEIVDISKMDETKIPVFSITGNKKSDIIINYNNGKGLTIDQARASAYMEFIERKSAGAHRPTLLTDSYYNLEKLYNEKVVQPSSIITYYPSYVVDSEKINWFPAIDITNSTFALLPTISILFPYTGDDCVLFRNNTNGLASGSTFYEAILQGIYEVIERDCSSIAIGTGKFQDVSIDSIKNEKCRSIIDEFEKNNIKVYIKNITNDLGIPCFLVTGDDTIRNNSLLLCGGHGCHSSKDIALLRALTEMAQTRKTILYGKREDIRSMRPNADDPNDYMNVKMRNISWYSNSTNQQSFKDISEYYFDNIREELNWIIKKIKGLGFSIFVSNLAPDNVDDPLPVVRVVIPGLENRNEDKKRIGYRLYRALKATKTDI